MRVSLDTRKRVVLHFSLLVNPTKQGYQLKKRRATQSGHGHGSPRTRHTQTLTADRVDWPEQVLELLAATKMVQSPQKSDLELLATQVVQSPQKVTQVQQKHSGRGKNKMRHAPGANAMHHPIAPRRWQ